MWTTTYLVLFWQLVSLTSATHGTIGMGITMYKPVCAYACHDSLSSLYLNCTTFSDDHSMEGMDMKLIKRMDMGGEVMGTTSMECYATDPAWLQTLAYCMKDRCGIDGVSESKIEKAYAALSMSEETYSSQLPAERPTTEVEADAMWLNTTSLVNNDLYYSNHQTLAEFEYQEDTHVRLSVAIIVISIGIALLAGKYNKFSAGSLGRFIPVGVSKHLILPALFNGRHLEPLPGKLGYAPSRIVSVLIFFYVFLNFIFCAVPYKSVWPHTTSVWFVSEKREIATYVANRTGVLSFANLALAILFAGRINPLLYLSGLSQTTCLSFHRWAARVCTIQAVVHSINYTFVYWWDDGTSTGYLTNVKLPYFWWGIIATIFLCLGITFSALPIRLYQYEIFLVTHIIIAIVAIVGCWYHIALRFGTNWGYEVWLYIAIAFWGFDRVARIAIAAYRNMGGQTTQAVAELVPGGKFMKLTVYPAKSWKFTAGQHAFLFFPSTGRFWENHPFSIAGWNDGSSLSTISQASGVTKKDVEKDMQISTAPITDGDSDTSDSHSHPKSAPQQTQIHTYAPRNRRSITFLLRPLKGLTKSLHRDLALTPNVPTYFSVTLEGPYGHTIDLSHADSILCVGGGIGITALLAYVQYFIECRRSSSPKIKASRLILAWSYREREFASIVRNMMPSDAAALGVECIWTCTGEKGAGEVEKKIGEGRLDVNAIVAGEIEGVKKLAVLVCAPGGLADKVRREVVALEGVGGTRIDLHEESFAW